MHSRESEPAFYRLLLQQTEEILPIVYTPTVGEACQRYHRLPLTPVGLHLRASDPCFLTKLQAWPHQNVRSGACRVSLSVQPCVQPAQMLHSWTSGHLCCTTKQHELDPTPVCSVRIELPL